jgi:HAD superfamily hydrolase (TIGR01509 family)
MSVSGLITTVIFDFDGVLADTERLHLRAFQQLFAARGWQLDEAVYFDRYLGYDDEGLVAAFDKDEHLGLPQAVLDALVAEKGEVFAGYLEAGDVLFPGAIACVENLAKHFTLGIASGALKTEITNILGAANLLAYFPVIVSAEDVDECKPAPEPYLTAARRLGVRPGVCVAIEDSPPGLQAARTAGMKTVGVTTTAARHLLSADLVIDRLDQFTPELVVSLARRLPG